MSVAKPTSLYGTQLSANDQRHVLSAYTHRFTREHVPAWAKETRPDGSAYPVQFDSDQEWLANTQFHVTASGDLDKRVNHCHSTPTWPDNPELRIEAA